MKMKTENVEMEYRGETFSCEKTVYACTKCDFELQQQWMKDKMEIFLQQAYAKKHSEK